MKAVLVAICCFAFSVGAEELTIRNVLEQNIGSVSGVLKDNVNVGCSIEIGEAIIPNGLGVVFVVDGDEEHSGLLLYSFPGPAEGEGHYFELDLESHAVVSYSASHEFMIKLFYNPETLKITEFGYFSDFGNTETKACQF